MVKIELLNTVICLRGNFVFCPRYFALKTAHSFYVKRLSVCDLKTIDLSPRQKVLTPYLIQRRF